MLHHVSLNARKPEAAARVLAGILDATPVRAPTPPFPQGSWFVCYGDAAGSMMEIVPWGTVIDPENPFGLGHDSAMRERSGAHVMVSTPRSLEEVQDVAAEAGWRTEIVDARLFKLVKVWVENKTLVELLTPDLAPAYAAAFNAVGLATLDRKLRDLEAGRPAA